jgi:hypothetical protein
MAPKSSGRLPTILEDLSDFELDPKVRPSRFTGGPKFRCRADGYDI